MLRLRLLLTLIIAGVLTLPLQAATITVADTGADHSSIQAAINAADNGDEIIVSPGTYLENINFNGKAITLRSASGDPDDTIIDGSGNGRVVTCTNGETSTTVLDGFTITNGSAHYGAGMVNEDSSPTITNCTFSGNAADRRGGGMFNYESRPTVSNCTFSGNSADDGGGNINADPLFVDADGTDNIVGTGDDNLRLSSGSPCIDAGDNAAVPARISFDLDGNPRFTDLPESPDTGNGTARLVDMGPYENIGLCLGDETSGDSDADGRCDNLDVCSGFDDAFDDDGDGVPDGCDLCPGFDDSDPDSDKDGVPDQCDTCDGFDDTLDDDGDGVPDDCDLCPGFDDNGPDADSDGVPDACDICEGFDDSGPDADNDGVTDLCDACDGFDDTLDGDADGVPDDCDSCEGIDDNLPLRDLYQLVGPDSDKDGIPDACDKCSLPGDINCDGIVNLHDLKLLALHWLETN